MADFSEEFANEIENMIEQRFAPELSEVIYDSDQLINEMKYGPTRMKIKFSCQRCRKDWTSTWGNI